MHHVRIAAHMQPELKVGLVHLDAAVGEGHLPNKARLKRVSSGPAWDPVCSSGVGALRVRARAPRPREG